MDNRFPKKLAYTVHKALLGQWVESPVTSEQTITSLKVIARCKDKKEGKQRLKELAELHRLTNDYERRVNDYLHKYGEYRQEGHQPATHKQVKSLELSGSSGHPSSSSTSSWLGDASPVTPATPYDDEPDIDDNNDDDRSVSFCTARSSASDSERTLW